MNGNIEDAPVYVILHQLIHLSKYQAFQCLEEYGLKPGQAGILFALSSNGKLSQRELAQKIGITPPSMTVALRKMEELGYIAKEPDSNDQRIIRILLTDMGQDCVGDIKAVLDRMEKILYQKMTKEEKMLLRRLLLQMHQNLLECKEFKGVDMNLVYAAGHPSVQDGL